MNILARSINDPSWAEFVSSHEQATIFHHPAWASLLAECYGFRPFVLLGLDARGSVTGGIPLMDVRSPLTGHRWVSLPFSDYCAPLCREPSTLNALMDYLVQQSRQCPALRIEIRADLAPRDRVFINTAYVRSAIELSADPEATSKMFSNTNVRQRIRAAVKRGVEVRRCDNQSGILCFYDLFAETHRRLGVPVQPKRFFSLIGERLIDKGLGFLILAYKAGHPIAGTFYLRFNKTITAKYNASLPESWSLSPNHLIHWTEIQWGCEHGYRYFDFGRTDVNSQSQRVFKLRWGAREVPLSYATISSRKPKPHSPHSLKLVAPIIRRAPLLLCRILGEVFYRHFA